MAPFLTFLTHGYSSVVALSYSWDFLIYTTIAFSEIFFLPVCAAKRSKRALIGFLAITRVIIKKQLNLARLNQLLTVKKDVHLQFYLCEVSAKGLIDIFNFDILVGKVHLANIEDITRWCEHMKFIFQWKKYFHE